MMAAAAVFPSPLLAQAAPDPMTDVAVPAQPSDEIVVTALRRNSTVQTTPIAISALGGEQLQHLGATTITDIIRQVPGLQLTESDSGRTRVSIRGVQAAGEATVGLYYGETPLSGPSGTSSDPAGAEPQPVRRRARRGAAWAAGDAVRLGLDGRDAARAVQPARRGKV
jgi:iron complex outermembrane receptor protein